jgi:thiamine-phosphate pyrophosphorylase
MKRPTQSFEWRRTGFEEEAPSTAPSGRSPSPAFAGADAMTPRLYLVTPPVGDAAAFARALDAALGAADVAAVLLRLAAADERTLINRAKALAEPVQRRDVALVLDGMPEIAARAGADGAHLTGIDAFDAALALLKPDRNAGAGGLASRHDAMLAAETGADYVMFGEPPPERRGRRPPFADIVERLAWWAELFEVPCVGYAAGLDEVEALAQAGADFIALGEWIWTEPQNTAATVAAAAQRLASATAPAGAKDRPKLTK